MAATLAAVSLIAACDGGDRPKPLANVQPIVIPKADTTTRVNFNIDDPTLEIPETFPVSDLDLLTLVWSDEFNGNQLDPEVWFFESGDGSQYGIPGWGNGERQWYLPDNAQLEDGKLKITARRETVKDFGFTSARINTRDRFAFKYGRIEASIKLPSGQGLWPAFWMLAQDSPYGEWPSSGEIDILEAVNLDGFPGPGGDGGGNEIFGTLHYGGGNLGRIIASNTYVPSTDVTEDFHTYAVEWEENEIRWYYDGILYAVENFWQSDAAPYPAPFDQPFYVLLNLAVGGNFPGAPDGSTPSEATMEVDWVRVYSGEEGAAEPAAPGIKPDVIIFAADGSEADLEPNYDPFGSGSSFATVADNSYANALEVSVGGGYGGGALAQLGLTGLTPGFATGYSEFVFKAKGLDADNTLVVKIEADGGATVQIDLTAPPADVAVVNLGDGWSQVVMQMPVFGDVSAASQIVFETLPGAYVAGDVFYLTDIGFNEGDANGGAPSLGIFSESSDENVTITDIVFAGNPVVIEAESVAVPPFDGLFSLELTFSDNSGGQGFGGAIIQFEDEDISAYDTLKFGIDTSAFAGFANLTVQFEPPAGGTNGGFVSLASYTPVETSGNWEVYEIPLADFTAVNPTLVNKLGFFNARDDQDALLAGTLYLDDIHLTTAGDTGGGGGGNIAVNGGFETGDFTGWEQFAGGGVQAVTGVNPSSGSFAANLVIPVIGPGGVGIDNLIKNANLQAGNLTPGAPVTVSFDMRGSLSGAGGVVFAELFSELAVEGVSKAEILGGASLNPVDAWTPYSFDTTLGPDVSGGVTLQLKVGCGPVEGCGAD
ncbi:MAG: glycoside hydrolase family 16 protein, partial [Gammaproteobacteria bacterium]